MKPKLTLGLSLLIALALVAFGLVYGSASGFADDRGRVDALLTGDGGLLTVVGYRASDALNLCVVAGRHLADGDADVAALRQAAEALRGNEPTPAAAWEQNQTLSARFAAVAAKLRQTEGFAADARDPRYLEMLQSDFTQYGQSEIMNTYNQAADDFNAKLAETLPGQVASRFGVKPCELFR